MSNSATGVNSAAAGAASVNPTTAVSTTVSALKSLLQNSAASEELSSVGGSRSESSGVATALNAAFAQLLTALADKSTASSTSDASSTALDALVASSLQNLQDTGASTVGNLVDTTA